MGKSTQENGEDKSTEKGEENQNRSDLRVRGKGEEILESRGQDWVVVGKLLWCMQHLPQGRPFIVVATATAISSAPFGYRKRLENTNTVSSAS